MARRHRWFTALLLILGTTLLPREALPIVMRHDVPERRYLDLARGFPTAVNVRPADSSRGLGGEGTLIAARWVLTAAHVAAEVELGDVVEVGTTTHAIGAVFIHPRWKSVNDVAFDVALVQMTSDVTGVKPAVLFHGPEPVGAVVTFVGRGGFGTGLTGLRGEDRSLRAATNRIDAVSEVDLQFRFDRPGDPHVTELEGISGPGDSGGAAYFERDGTLYVIGVSCWQDTKPTGRVQGRYGVVEHYVRVTPHYPWLTRTMQAASAPSRPR